MPTIIQTHLVVHINWDKTKDKAKGLEHIIRRCEPPLALVPTLAPGTSVPGLYSHMAQQTKGKPRGKPKQQ